MPKVKKDDVRYLAFSGGGGKGIAYLGVIQALEENKILPVPGNIKGISGSSAGAITAFLLALGYDYKTLVEVFSNSNNFIDKGKPDLSNIRHVYRWFDPERKLTQEQVKYYRKAVTIESLLESELKAPFLAKYHPYPPKIKLIHSKEDLSEPEGSKSESAIGNPLAELLINIGIKNIVEKDSPVLNQILLYPIGYFNSLLITRGFFKGEAARVFLQKALKTKFKEENENPTTVTFDYFCDKTKIDLVITGSNVLTNEPIEFSRRSTPDFPVVEAVAISLSFPILFKPVYISGDKSLNGLWCDGGLLNNYPIHAFDFEVDPLSDKYPHLKPLNPYVLGFHLKDGPCNEKEKPFSIFDFFGDYLGMLKNTVAQPTNQGQIRCPEEKHQSINIDTFCLTIDNFTPFIGKQSKQNADKAIKGAYDKVKDYFK